MLPEVIECLVISLKATCCLILIMALTCLDFLRASSLTVNTKCRELHLIQYTTFETIFVNMMIPGTVC